MTQPHNNPEDDATIAAGSLRPPGPRTIATASDLEESVCELHLLDVQQQTELISLRGKFSEPKALAREMLQRNWLTPFQVNQLFQGKGTDLTLGTYILLERIGEGGMGAVYKARHQLMKRIVAIKLIRKDRLAGQDVVKRFYREFQAAASVEQHPNIVMAYDADRVGDVHFLVMEYVEGGDLAKEVKKRGPLPIAQACEHIRQAALGLQHAHERGLVHRDIKPGNLLLSRGTVKILDLGLARLGAGGEHSGDLTQEGAVMGTPDYIAPEQAHESHTVDARADIYSLGCSLYFLLTGKVPFPGGTLMQKMMKHQREEPPSLQSHRPEVPAGLSAVVSRMMAKKPEDRYQTAAEAARALEPFHGTQPPAAIPLTGVTAALPVAVPVVSQGVTASPPMAVPLTAAADDAGGETLPPGAGESSPSWTGYILKKLKLPHRPERRRWVFAGAGAGLLLLVLLVILLRPGPPPRPEKTGLDAFEYAGIPETNIVKGQPKYLVGVLGEHRVRHRGLALKALAIRPDGKWAATVAADGFIRLCDPETLVERRSFTLGPEPVTCLAFSASGKYLAAGTATGLIRLYDTDEGKELEPFRDGHKGAVNEAVFSKDRYLLSAGADATVGVWDVSQHKLRHAFTEHSTPVRCIAVSADGQNAISGAGTVQGEKVTDCEPRMWVVANGKLIRTLAPAALPTAAVALPPDDPAALSIDSGGTLRWWDAEGKIIRTAGGADLNSSSIVLSRDGRHFLTWNYRIGNTTLWETSSGRELRFSKVPAQGNGVFMPDNRRVLAPFEDTLRVWDSNADKELMPRKGHTQRVMFLGLRENGRVLMSGGPDGMHRWDLDQKTDRTYEDAAGVRHAVSPSGDYALSLVTNVPIHINLTDLKSGRVLRTLRTPELGGSFVRFLDEKQAIYDLAGGFVGVWDTDADKEAARYQILPAGAVSWIVPSPDGKLWFCKTSTGLAILWDREQNKSVASWPSSATAAAFSPDGTKLYFGASSAEVGVFNLPYDEKSTHTYFRLHKSAVQNLALSPDGQRLVTSDANGHLVLWDTSKRGDNKIDEWDQLGGVGSLLFADDKHLIVGNNNATIYILRLPRE